MPDPRRVLLLLAITLVGCTHIPRARAPMRVVGFPAGTPADTLVVFLPGLKDRAEVFQREGFIKAFERHQVHADLLAVDAHRSYYTSGTLIHRLHRDVIGPRLASYKRVLIVGVSMGGYGAVRYTMAHPEKIEALLLFSPFLGAGPVMRELAEAGDEDFTHTWDWLKGATRPRILLGYGKEDPFLASNHALAELLEREDVITTHGGHFWGVWLRLLDQLLAREPRSAARVGL